MNEPAGGPNPYAPPTAAVDDVEAAGPAGVLAGRGTRLGAALIDIVISLVAFGVIGALTPFNIFDVEAMETAGPVRGIVVPALLGLAVFAAIHGWLLATRGQTVGKLLLRIRIVQPNGAAVPFGRVFGLRYALPGLIVNIPFIGWLFGLVDALMIFRDSRRCLHDQIADTIVVKA